MHSDWILRIGSFCSVLCNFSCVVLYPVWSRTKCLGDWPVWSLSMRLRLFSVVLSLLSLEPVGMLLGVLCTSFACNMSILSCTVSLCSMALLTHLRVLPFSFPFPLSWAGSTRQEGGEGRGGPCGGFSSVFVFLRDRLNIRPNAIFFTLIIWLSFWEETWNTCSITRAECIEFMVNLSHSRLCPRRFDDLLVLEQFLILQLCTLHVSCWDASVCCLSTNHFSDYFLSGPGKTRSSYPSACLFAQSRIAIAVGGSSFTFLPFVQDSSVLKSSNQIRFSAPHARFRG